MKFQTNVLLTLILPMQQSYAFTARSSPFTSRSRTITSQSPSVSLVPPSSTISTRRTGALQSTSSDTDEEIERLKSMAAKLRAEAAALESEQQKAVAKAAEKAFQKFDLDKDGRITVEELKQGLEKEFKMELSEKRVQKLLEDFDKSGDGVLQKDEFTTVDVLRNRLDALVREEKALALEKSKAAKMEEEAYNLIKAQLDMLNDKEPTTTDKFLSTLPYLFPLLDGLQFAKYLVLGNPDNPASVAIAILYGFYRAIPFGGILTFFALSFLAGNIRLNRLIRFNIQQAIFLDISLFFPGLVAALIALVTPPGTIPQEINVLGDNILFLALLSAVGYSVVSSLLGIEPNNLPLISDAVTSRMPTIEMFDSQGRFLPKNPKEFEEMKKDNDTDDSDSKKKDSEDEKKD